MCETRPSPRVSVRRAERCLSTRQGDSIYICGSPGTGKSVTVDCLPRALGSPDDWSARRCRATVSVSDRRLLIVKINAMALPDPPSIYPELLDLVKPDLPRSSAWHRAVPPERTGTLTLRC
jgi:Cdc6-like AAA superfamily ATPase